MTMEHVNNILPDLFGFPLVHDTASEHFSQNAASLKAGQLNGWSSISGVNKATYSTKALLSSVDHDKG